MRTASTGLVAVDTVALNLHPLPEMKGGGRPASLLGAVTCIRDR
jgi:hypothetical protein